MAIAAPSYSIRVNELASFSYSGTLKDENGVIIGPTDLTTLTFTLYDQDTNTIINSHNDQNALNANNWTLTSASSGNLTWLAKGADNPIVDDSKETEVHILLLKWTYGTGLQGNKCVAIRVVNIVRIP